MECGPQGTTEPQGGWREMSADEAPASMEAAMRLATPADAEAGGRVCREGFNRASVREVAAVHV
jgi:hypothetical protein